MTITPDVRRQFFMSSHQGTQQVIRLPPASISRSASNRGMGRPWTQDEHDRFLQGLEMFPKGPWSRIAEHVGTRTPRQTMTHAQKYRERIARRSRSRFSPLQPPIQSPSPQPSPPPAPLPAPASQKSPAPAKTSEKKASTSGATTLDHRDLELYALTFLDESEDDEDKPIEKKFNANTDHSGLDEELLQLLPACSLGDFSFTSTSTEAGTNPPNSTREYSS